MSELLSQAVDSVEQAVKQRYLHEDGALTESRPELKAWSCSHVQALSSDACWAIRRKQGQACG